MMRNATLLFLPSVNTESLVTMRIIDGLLIPANISTDDPREGDGTKILVLPVGLNTSQRYILPQLPERQAMGIARRRAMDEAIGGEGGVHSVAFPVTGKDGAYDVVTIARTDLAHAISWGQEQGFDADLVLPIGMLLPDPGEGFVTATIAGQNVVRGEGLFLPGDEGFVAAVIGDARPVKLDEVTVRNGIVAAAFDTRWTLRTGPFAKRLRQPPERSQIMRILSCVAAILLVTLLMTTARIVKLNRDTVWLNDVALDSARPFAPDARDASSVQAALTSRLVQTGKARGSLTGLLATIIQVIEAHPGVTMTSLDRNADGQIRVALTTPSADSVTDLSQQLRDAGYRVETTVSTEGRTADNAILTVMP